MRWGAAAWLFALAACIPAVGQDDPAPLRFGDLDYGFPVRYALEDPRVAYVDQGSGPGTLLLVHGLASNLGLWRYNIPELARHYRVIAVDLPGYGRSEKSADYSYSLRSQAATLARLIAELGLDDVTLVGQSMGGQIAMITALHHPDAVRRLVLVNTAGIEGFNPEEGAAIRTLYSVEGIRDTPEEAVRRNIAANFHRWPEHLEWMVQERLRLARTAEFDRFAEAVVRSVGAMLDEPTTPLLENIRHPTLLLYGEEDALIPNRFFHPGTPAGIFGRGAERIPDATLIALPAAGHLSMMEQPEAFNRALLEWLKRH